MEKDMENEKQTGVIVYNPSLLIITHVLQGFRV